jgi:hypothetical protein
MHGSALIWGPGRLAGELGSCYWWQFTVLPNRPIMGVALDPTVPAANLPVGYAAIGGFNPNTPSMPGHVFSSDLHRRLWILHMGGQDREPAG